MNSFSLVRCRYCWVVATLASLGVETRKRMNCRTEGFCWKLAAMFREPRLHRVTIERQMLKVCGIDAGEVALCPMDEVGDGNSLVD